MIRAAVEPAFNTEAWLGLEVVAAGAFDVVIVVKRVVVDVATVDVGVAEVVVVLAAIVLSILKSAE